MLTARMHNCMRAVFLFASEKLERQALEFFGVEGYERVQEFVAGQRFVK